MLSASHLVIGHAGAALGAPCSVRLSAGRVCALLGPNGAGKTTLMRTLLGLIAPVAGEILIEGRPLAGLDERERARRMAWVPQQQAGGFDWPVRELVLMGRSAHGGLLAAPSAHDRAVVAAALERLGIAALADRPLSRLSGGERQLSLIARALAQQARLVMLDEPTASLDFGNQGRVMREVRRLADAGMAVLFSTHDPNLALRHADEAWLLQAGRVCEQGEAATVLDAHRLSGLYGVPVRELPLMGPPGRLFLTD
jgi:iron complex transport system ATP-binding protein